MISILIAMTLASPTLSVHVEGDGYLRLAREGRVVYATSAKLSVSDGHLVANGASFLPGIDVPASATLLDVDLQGEVFAITGSSKTMVGQIVLATFAKGSIVLPSGDFFTAADRPTLGNPGDGLNGVIRVNRTEGADRISKTDGVNKTALPPPSKPAVSLNTQHLTPNTQHLAPISHLPAGAAEVIIHPESSVQGDSFTLGEIADITADADLQAKLASADMGRSPIVGVNRGLDTNFILAKLRTAGYKVDHITVTTPEGAHLTRACQSISASQLVEAAGAAVKEQLGLAIPLRLVNDVQDATAPIGKLELRAGTPVKSANGISLMIDIRVDDKHWTTRNLLLAPAANGGDGVKAGQIVKVLVKLNGASLECTGRARNSAWIGEQVTVTTDTGAIQTGIVTGPNTVEVKL